MGPRSNRNRRSVKLGWHTIMNATHLLRAMASKSSLPADPQPLVGGNPEIGGPARLYRAGMTQIVSVMPF